MSIYCDYKDCKVKRKEGKTFFKFPTSDMSRALIWAVYAGRPELTKVGQYALMSKALCADHFDMKYFSGEKDKRLTKDALPNMHGEVIVNGDMARKLADGGADALLMNRQQMMQMVLDLPPLLNKMTVTTNGANIEEDGIDDDLEPPVLTMEDGEDNLDCRTEASITTNCNDSLLESYTINDNSDYIDEFSLIAIEERVIPIQEIIEDRNDINEINALLTTNRNSQYNIPACITVTELISDSIGEELLPSAVHTYKPINANSTSGIPNIEEFTITLASNETVNNETSEAKDRDLTTESENQNVNNRKANENGEGVTKIINQNANSNDDIITNIFAVNNSIHHNTDQDESTVAKKGNLQGMNAVAGTNSIQNPNKKNSIYNEDEVVTTIRNRDANEIAQKANEVITESRNQQLANNDKVTSSNDNNSNEEVATASTSVDKNRNQNANYKQEVVAITIHKNNPNKIGKKTDAATTRSRNDHPTEATNNANPTNTNENDSDADEELEAVDTNRNRQTNNNGGAATNNTDEDDRQSSHSADPDSSIISEIPSYETICAEFTRDSKRLDEIEGLIEVLAVNRIRNLITKHDVLEWLRRKISQTLVGAVSLQLDREPHDLSEDERMFLFNIKDGLGRDMQRKLGWRIPMDALSDDDADTDN